MSGQNKTMQLVLVPMGSQGIALPGSQILRFESKAENCLNLAGLLAGTSSVTACRSISVKNFENICLLIDEPEDIVEVSLSDLLPAPALLKKASLKEAVAGFYFFHSRLYTIVNLFKILKQE